MGYSDPINLGGEGGVQSTPAVFSRDGGMLPSS